MLISFDLQHCGPIEETSGHPLANVVVCRFPQLALPLRIGVR